MNFETILYEVKDHVATVTLNRPDRLNAFTRQMMADIIAALDLSDADDDVRCVIFTGAGRGFCAGADLGNGLSAFRSTAGSDDGVPRDADGAVDWSDERLRDGGGRVALRIYDSLKPMIAAINGPAAGVGITMTLPMDVRLAARGAKIGFVFARRGIVPEAAATYFLPRIVGISRALEWVAAGRIFRAEEGVEAGLFRSVYEPEDLLPAARALAAEIAGSAPVAVALARKMLWQGLTMRDPMEAHRLDSRAIFSRARSADAKEGVASFLEKREPDYPDRVSTGMPEWFPWWQPEPWA
jgi:enoyl-CoA hydratase/carnithine racemase